MTIQEITELRKQECEGILKMPNSARGLDSETLREINYAVKYLARADKRSLLLLVKMLIKGFKGVKSLKGVGVKNCPYEIDTVLGSGAFYGAHEYFDGEVLPKDIKKNQCFNNCYLAVTKGYIKDCQILSGIAYRGGRQPFLHSVLRVENKILDFNYDLCMDEELYITLFNFEVLSQIDSNKMLEDYHVVKKYHKLLNDKGFKTIHAVFAWDDLVDFVINKDLKKSINIEIV